jgi:ketosteroid isomerase-like protein
MTSSGTAWRALALVAVLSGCTTGTRPAVAPPPAATSAEVATAARGVLEQWRQAYEVRSVDALASLYAHDPGVSVVLDGTLSLGWAEVEPVLRDRVGKATAIHVRFKDISVGAVGLTGAVVVATLVLERGDATTSVTENGAVTLVLRNEGGWLIVAEHYSYKRT